MNLVKNLGDRLLGAFLPEVAASATCIDAHRFCRCVRQGTSTYSKRYLFNSTCTSCYWSGYC